MKTLTAILAAACLSNGAFAQLTYSIIVPSSARAAGANGAFYTTDLSVANTGATSASATLKFLGHDQDGTSGPQQSFTIPAGATSVKLNTQLFYDTESGSTFDTFTLSVVDGATVTSVWSKATSSPAMSVWVPITVDLTAYAGKNVQLRFNFTTGDGAVNSTLGVLFDDVKVTRACP